MVRVAPFLRCGLLALFTAFLLAGCAAPPLPPDAGKLAKGAKVGLLVQMPARAEHMHVSTTAFNNFSTSHSLPWNPAARAYEIFAADLERAGFQVVRLSGVVASTSVDALAVSKDGRWSANPAQQAAARKLRDDHVAAVVLVQGVRTLTRLECFGGPCAESYMANSGLFTRGMLASTRYFAVPAMEAKVFVMDPALDLSAYEPLKTLQRERVRQLKDFSEPRDLKRLTPAEFAPVASSIDAHLRALSRSTAQALSGGAR